MILRKLPYSRSFLYEDGLNIDEIKDKFFIDLKALSSQPEKHFVHGDYYFSNVLVNDQLEVSSVLDVSPHSHMGDFRMDVAGSLIFAELHPSFTLSEGKYLENLAKEKYGENIMNSVDLYRIYYSLLFSDCKLFDPSTYNWGIRNLRHYIMK